MKAAFDTQQIKDVIKHRRRIYPKEHHQGKTIPDEITWQTLEKANHAPNHKQTVTFQSFFWRRIKTLCRITGKPLQTIHRQFIQPRQT